MSSWKYVEGYSQRYEVSVEGKVRSNNWTVTTEKGSRTYKGRVIKPSVNHRGYSYLVLYKDKKPRTHRVHRLVAKAFIPNVENKPQVNHIDGNKLNNVSDNLEWVNNSENQRHSLENGLRKTKLTSKDVKYIRNKYASGKYSYSQLSKLFGVEQSNIYKIVKRKTWKHINGI